MFSSFKFKVIAILLISIGGFISFSFSSSSNAYSNLDYISRESSSLNKKIVVLDQAAGSYATGKISIDSLQRVVAGVRINYKKIEFYLAFNHSEYVKEHLNGAPLLYISRAGSRANVLEPEGLQVLDELVYTEEAGKEKHKIAAIAKKLRNSYSLIDAGLSPKRDEAAVITAMRLQLIRIFTFSLTGFDTPGSLNAITEAQASLQGMRTYLLENYQSKKIHKVTDMFDKAIADLEHKTFDNLDRLLFLKNYIDPLYAQLGELGYPAPEYLSKISGWNPNSQSIFSPDFLDPYFYTALKSNEDSSELKDLGKKLFYDPMISSDGQISCASCHHPDKAFTDAVPKSLSSIQGRTVLRNAPTLLNAVYADRYFYDLRAFTLEQQAEHVIFNHDEFNTAYSDILKKLKADKEYIQQFSKLFGNNAITREYFSKALASYVLSLKSFDSTFDKYVRNKSATISQEAKNGFNLFMGKAGCATCHFAPVFSGLVPPFYNENESEILGVLVDPNAQRLQLDGDEGRYKNQIHNEEAWIFEKSFKTTTVRNAALTAPYFHNGAYKTLEEVIDFYNEGGGAGLGLNVVNQTLPPDKLDLSEKEKRELIAFIESLSDTSSAKE